MKKNKSTIGKILLGSSVILASSIIITKRLSKKKMGNDYDESTNFIKDQNSME